jgi:signal transduction histidine kinase
MFDIDREETDLLPIVADIIKMFEPLAQQMELKLIIDIPNSLPKIFVDGNKIKHIITNLISNAMKFTPKGGTIAVMAETKNDQFVLARVKDSGIGIPKDKLTKVFNKFEQVKEAQNTEKKIKGTGLGLTIAKNIVELHGGTIWIESEEGKGSSFIFTLPRAKSG